MLLDGFTHGIFFLIMLQEKSFAGEFHPAVCWLLDFLCILMMFQAVVTEAKNHQFQARCVRSAGCRLIEVLRQQCVGKDPTGCTRSVSFQDLTCRQCNLICFVTSDKFHQIFNSCPANSFGEPSDFLSWPLDFASARNTEPSNFGVLSCVEHLKFRGFRPSTQSHFFTPHGL